MRNNVGAKINCENGELNHPSDPESLEIPEGDHVLTQGGAWFSVKGFSVRICATSDGVSVDVYPLGNEMEDALASCFAYDADSEAATD